MNSAISLIRAITALYAQHILKLISIMAGVAFGILYLVVILLGANHSLWWYVVLLALIPLTIVVGIIGWFAWWTTRKLMPRRLRRDEKNDLLLFRDKIAHVVTAGKTPAPLLWVALLRDVAMGRGSHRLQSIIEDSRELKDDFERLRALFDKPRV